MRTFQTLGLLLTYPTADLLTALPELRQVLQAEEALSAPHHQSLEPVFKHLTHTPLLDAQEGYVALFDRHPGLSLHLFEHVYGESRDRGQALAELADLYAASDLFLTNGETPDYLPAFLEFMAGQPEKEARRLLGEVGHILLLLAERLEQRQNVYAPVLKALCSLCEPHPEANRAAAAAAINPDIEPDPEATWAEPEAFPNPGCASNSLKPLPSKPTHVTIEEPHHG